MRIWVVALMVAVWIVPTAIAKPFALGAFHEWDALKNGARKSYTAGGVTLMVVARKRPHEDLVLNVGDNTATLTVTASDGATRRMTFQGGFGYPKAELAITKLDPANPVPQVILSVYTGGAHCCQEVTVFVHREGAWKTYDVGGGHNTDAFDFPTDIDGDGVADLIVPDDRFAYAFSGFAGSFMPPRVYTIKDGAVVDVSASCRYDRVYRSSIKHAKEDGASTGVWGLCAGYAADAARLGTFKSVWREVLVNYDRNENGGWPDGCKHPRPDANCRPGPDNRFRSFPEALAAFLRKLGYITRAQERWAVAESRNPEHQRR